MKRYISAILIPSFLLQLFGCYSLREISLEDLSNFKEATITTRDSKTYYLKKHISNYWIIEPGTDVIVIITQKPHIENRLDSEVLVIKTDTTTINYNDINSVKVEKFDIGKTFLYFGIPLVTLSGLYLLLRAKARDTDYWK